ncbi:hypothetical protein [Streptomyces sp. NBC_00887]|uniref:hypothetical protein n=1 Tax=Streptomyces sp. NBC_00887 TaxID=2975859 RepID=UPI00386CE110|nr:hypothetical protein OG844_46215 [Streptomyces sp. NBC_00887]
MNRQTRAFVVVRRHLMQLGGILVATAGAVALAASPASAHPQSVAAYGDDFAFRALDSSNGIFVFDHTADGHGVYANVHLSNGTKVWGWQSSPLAPNGLWAGGASGPGGSYYFGGGLRVDWIQVCRDTVGCSAWVPVYDGS